MYGFTLCSEDRQGDISRILFQGSPPWHDIKNKMVMDTFTYPPVKVSSPSEHKTSLCSTGVFRLDTQGRRNTFTHYYAKPSIWHCSLGNTSALQGKSLTASWEQSATLGFYYTSEPKDCAANLTTIILPTSIWWCGGRLVGRGVKALDSSVERLWFNLQSTSASFSCHAKATSPSVYWCRLHH